MLIKCTVHFISILLNVWLQFVVICAQLFHSVLGSVNMMELVVASVGLWQYGNNHYKDGRLC